MSMEELREWLEALEPVPETRITLPGKLRVGRGGTVRCGGASVVGAGADWGGLVGALMKPPFSLLFYCFSDVLNSYSFMKQFQCFFLF